MRAAALFSLLAISGCADVLGIEDAHLDDRDSTLPDSGPLPGASGKGSGGTHQNGSSDEDDASQGSSGPEGSDGGVGAAPSTGESPDDSEPELPPSHSDGGVAGSPATGGTSGAAGADTSSGGSGGTGSGGEPSSGGTSSSGGSSASGGSAGSEEPPSLSCQSYCASVLANCSGEYAQYRNEQECLAVCALLPLGTVLSTSGNSVACRQSQATLAALSPAAHCKSAGPAGNGQCGSTCEGYCSIVLSACKTGKHSFANLAKCSELCLDRTDLANYGVTPALGYDSGETQQCLVSHATAATSATKECESAVGSGKCKASDDD